MKYLSVLALMIVMVLSWAGINRPFQIPPHTHEQIQGELAQIIENVIRESSASISNFKILKLWTETVNYNRIKAQFIYSYTDQSGGETVKQTREGQAILNRETFKPGQKFLDSSWSLDQVHVLNSRLEYESGSVVRPLTVE